MTASTGTGGNDTDGNNDSDAINFGLNSGNNSEDSLRFSLNQLNTFAEMSNFPNQFSYNSMQNIGSMLNNHEQQNGMMNYPFSLGGGNAAVNNHDMSQTELQTHSFHSMQQQNFHQGSLQPQQLQFVHSSGKQSRNDGNSQSSAGIKRTRLPVSEHYSDDFSSIPSLDENMLNYGPVPALSPRLPFYHALQRGYRPQAQQRFQNSGSYSYEVAANERMKGVEFSEGANPSSDAVANNSSTGSSNSSKRMKRSNGQAKAKDLDDMEKSNSFSNFSNFSNVTQETSGASINSNPDNKGDNVELSSASKRLRWTENDAILLWKSIAKYGNEWTDVYNNVKSRIRNRTYHQVKDKGRRMLQQNQWHTGRMKEDYDGACQEAKDIAQAMLKRLQAQAKSAVQSFIQSDR